MSFKLKSIGKLLGINEELSSYSHPVFEKDLGPNVIAEAVVVLILFQVIPFVFKVTFAPIFKVEPVVTTVPNV